MSAPRLTASGLARAEKCPASASLPHIGTLTAASERGTAIHAEREAAEPDGAEMAFAYDVVTGVGRVLGQGLGRDYGVLGENEVAGTADKVTMEGATLVIRDYKTGVGFNVAPARVNVQLAFYAVAATSALGQDAARVELVYTDQDDRIDAADLDAFDLAAARERIRAIWTAVRAESPRVVVGDHCSMCPAIRSCPAHRAVLQAFGSGAAADILPDRLTDALVAETWPIYQQARRAMGLYEQAVRAYVSAVGSVPMAGGKRLALRSGERREVDGRIALHVLRDMHGQAVADAAVEASASAASIERALAAIAPPKGKARLVREVMRAIEAANGVTVRRTAEQFVIEDEQPAALPAKGEAA